MLSNADRARIVKLYNAATAPCPARDADQWARAGAEAEYQLARMVPKMLAAIDAAPGKPGAGKGAVEELVAAGRELLRTTRLTTFAGGPTSKICDRFELALAEIDPVAGTEGGGA